MITTFEIEHLNFIIYSFWRPSNWFLNIVVNNVNFLSSGFSLGRRQIRKFLQSPWSLLISDDGNDWIALWRSSCCLRLRWSWGISCWWQCEVQRDIWRRRMISRIRDLRLWASGKDKLVTSLVGLFLFCPSGLLQTSDALFQNAFHLKYQILISF